MTTSGSPQFDQLRAAFLADPALRQETEWAFRLAVETYNPSDRGLRFITGGIGEWIVTLAAYRAGVVTLPLGHSADGHDTQDLLAQARALWSIKTSYKDDNGKFTITNGQGGPGAGLIVPTIFLSPNLPGIVYVNPDVHPDMVALQEPTPDSMKLAKRHVAAHAADRPECVVPFTMPINPGSAVRDPALEAVRLLVDGQPQFPRLSVMFRNAALASTTIVEQLRELISMRDSGALTEEAYVAAVQKVTSL